MSPFVSSIIATGIISTLSLTGGFLLLHKKLLTQQLIPYLVSFAAGVMLAAAFLDILPEALEEGEIETVIGAMFIGIVFSFIVERSILWHHHHEDTHKIKPSGVLVLFGDAIHNFIDGVAISAAFLINPVIGITTTIAIAAHELPQELADFSVLIYSGFKQKQALLFNFLSALTALAGAIVGFSLLTQFEELLPNALGFTAGMFVYIACADLIPELHTSHENKRQTQILPFLLGIGLLSLLGKLFVE
ncbi:ZIP family metal transporter [Candidatus Roizmanbacteria bacterium]|nr:ZIP family metal transporter [Candidatus Roizmanbacteria bacterium]